MNLDTYHRYAALFDAFATIVGDGGHCSDVTLFEGEGGPALREWASARGLELLSEDHESVDVGTWTRIEVRIGRNASIRVHLDVVAQPATGTEPEPQPVEPEIAF